MSKITKTYRVSMVLLAVFLLILIALFLIVSVPTPVTVTDSVGEATIFFETLDSIIANDQSCYVVRWEVEGIEEVHLNDNGKIGSGEEQLCYNFDGQPELQVTFKDQSEETYILPITIIQRQPSFWIVVGIATVLLFFATYFLIAPTIGITLRSRKSIVYGVINLVALIILTLIIVGGTLELGLRFYFTNYGTDNDLIAYVYSGNEIQKQTSRLAGVPYVLYVANPNYVGHNSLGYRGDEITIEKPDNTFRIVAVGASTTYGFGVNSNLAYPDLLQDILHDEYSYAQVEVINAGVPGYTSYELLANFQFRVLDLNPDLAIYYGAKNDSDTRFEDPGCYNNPSPMYGLTTFHGLWRTEFSDLPPSVLYRYFAINTGLMEVPNSVEFALAEVPIAEECYADESYTEEELLERNQPIFAERNFRNFLALAEFNGIDVLVSEFVHPTQLSEVNGDEKLLMSPAKSQALDEINTLYRNIAEEMDVPYYALTEDFVIEPGMFWTEVHMRGSGTKNQARLYAQYLVENDLIPPPTESD